MPDAIRDAPELLTGLENYFSAFWELGTCRPIGMGGAGYIPWTAIDQYARRKKYSDEEFDVLLYMVRKMDDAWIDHQNEKAKAASNTK